MNYHQLSQPFTLELSSFKQDEVSPEELEKHDMLRVDISDVKNYISDDDEYISFIRNRYLNKDSEDLGKVDDEYISKINSTSSESQLEETDSATYTRECDTLDTFMCSAFYFLRFPDAKNNDTLIAEELAKKMFPVDFYSGGKEHTVGHLLYSRFVHKFLYDQ